MYVVFIDKEKAFQRADKEAFWNVLETFMVGRVVIGRSYIIL